MQSQYLKGIKATRTGQLFPSSPTLIKSLSIPEDIKSAYLVNRSKLLKEKNTNKIYDKRLRPYQNEDVNYLMQFKNGIGVFNEQRTGKTPTTLITLREKKENRNIIVVPKSVVNKWEQEYKRWHGGNVYTVKDHWTKKRRIKFYEEIDGTLIINYDKLSIDYLEIIDALAPFDAIVVDEAHMLRNYKGMSSKTKKKIMKDGKIQNILKYSSPLIIRAIMQARVQSKNAYALTGTPSPNKADNICGILAFLFPDIFNSYNQTAAYYFNVETKENYGYGQIYKETQGYKDENKKKELTEFLELFSIQRKRKDVMKWIPEVDYQTIYLDAPAKLKQYHKELAKFKETDDQLIVSENTLTAMLAQRQLSSCPETLGLDIPNVKFDWIEDHIKDYPETPIIITSFFTSGLKILQERLKPYKPIMMIGDTSADNREKAERDFQEGKSNILIGNIDVIKVGLTLSRAEEIIFIDQTLVYTDNLQLKDRFLPVTQEEAENKNNQIIYKLIVNDSIDMYLEEQLNHKKSQTEIINDYKVYLKSIKGG